MASRWEVTILPAPDMITYNALTESTHPQGDDVWLSPCSLLVTDDIPGIPLAYAAEEYAGCAVYVTGLHFSTSPGDLEIFFGCVAPVACCPSLIALGSMHTFRWVVYHEAEAAMAAVMLLNGAVVDGGFIRIIEALPPNRVVRVVNWTDENGDMTPTQQSFDANLTPRPGDLIPYDIGDKFPQSHVTSSHVVSYESTRADAVSSSSLEREASNPSSPSDSSFVTAPLIPEDSPPAEAAEPVVNKESSWAAIAGRDQESQNTVINIKSKKVTRLNPVGRIPHVETIRTVNAAAEPFADQKRVILLLNLPNNIHLRDVSDAVREGSIAKIVFGVNEDDKSRYAGIIFQRAQEAERFYDVLQREREESRPNRFRFIVDACIGEPFPINDDIRAMGYPTHATRRLTLVKAGFFFMCKEEHLRRFCQRLVPAENIQLIWLYNGGNATIVFSDVANAIKVKKELDGKAETAGKPNGAPGMWAGLVTTFSKDPSLVPLDDLKSALYQ